MTAHNGFHECQGYAVYSFLMDGNVHLRYPQPGGDEKLCPVRSLSVAGGMLIAEWTTEAKTQGLPPENQQDLSIYAMRKGVLHVCSGKVMDTTHNDCQRLRIKVDSSITKVSLRKHQRYVIRGLLSVGPSSGEYTYVQDSDREMDLSLGGFGCRLPRSELDKVISGQGGSASGNYGYGEDIDPAVMTFSIRLVAYADCCGKANHDLPAVTLVCHAELRRRVRIDHSHLDTAGFQFADMPLDEHETLKLWLAANSLYLRAC